MPRDERSGTVDTYGRVVASRPRRRRRLEARLLKEAVLSNWIVKVFNVLPGKEVMVRQWFEEENRRMDEARGLLAEQTLLHEEIYLIETRGGAGYKLMFVADADSHRVAEDVFAQSVRPIDLEHNRVMAEALGDRLYVERLIVYDANPEGQVGESGGGSLDGPPPGKRRPTNEGSSGRHSLHQSAESE